MAKEANTPRATIVGGSMAGLFAAIFLLSRGWQVEVFERAHELADRGAGIVTHDLLYNALRAAGVTLRPEMGIRSRGRMMLNAGGAVIGTYDMAQILTSWGLIYRFLRQQLPESCYHKGVALKDIKQHPTGCEAIFSDGNRVESDWVIGADGTQSTVRHLVAPEVPVNYCGYYIWRGLVDERLIPAEVLEELEGRMAFGMAPGGHWLGYLVAGTEDKLEPGDRRYNWGWYRSGDESVLRDLLTDAAGVHHANGIPHDRIRFPLRDAMRTEAARFLAPQIQAIIAATDTPYLQAIYDMGCDRLVHGRVVLIGDAAFTARPHVGMGISKAADDATTLATALSDDPAGTGGTLAAWERDRLGFGLAVMDWGRDLGSYLGPPPQDEAHRKKAEHYQRPEILMSVTAAPDPSKYLSI